MSTLAVLRRSVLGSALLLLSLFAFAACDSNGDDDDVDVEDLDGRYTFSTFEFRPANPNLPTANILSQVNASSTFLNVIGRRGTFDLEYKVPGDNIRRLIGGEIDVDGGEVRLSFSGDDNPEELLLPGTLRLNIENGGAMLSVERERSGVNLEEYEDRLGIPEGERQYTGITSASGQLVIALNKSE